MDAKNLLAVDDARDIEEVTNLNLAIIIGVSTYTGNITSDLPACENDAKIITKIIEESGRFEEHLLISGEARSAETKAKISDFIIKHKDSNIEELFFYFSGHGYYDGSEFYYVLSDYNSNKIKQTAIENSEIDNLFRSLGAKNVIKVVDACNSGVGYIKEVESIQEYIKSTQGSFKKCYFMFSSQNDQKSYASGSISFFSRSFVRSIAEHKNTSIRYKDIVDYISDDFAENNKQRPLFAIQADFTEVFMEINQSLRDYLLKTVESDKNPLPKDDESNLDIVELAAKISESYKEKKYIQDALLELKEVDPHKILSKDINSLFDVAMDTSSSSNDFLDSRVIGEWIEKDKSDPPLFAKATADYRIVSRRVPRNSSYSYISSIFQDINDDQHYTTKQSSERFVDGFDHTEELPYKGLVIDITPRYPVLKKYTLYFVPLFSRTKAVCFSRHVEYAEEGFGKFRPLNKTKWFFHEVAFNGKESLALYFKRRLQEFGQAVVEDVKKSLSPKEIDDSSHAEPNDGKKKK